MEKKRKKHYGFFGGQLEVQDKIEELKTEGYPSDNLYVIAKDNQQINALRTFSGVHFSTEQEGDWIDKFRGLFSGSHSLINVFEEMGFTRDEAEDHNRRIENGEIFLFADDEEYNEVQLETDDIHTGEEPFITGNYYTDEEHNGMKADSANQPVMSRTERRKQQSGVNEESLLLHEEQLEVHKERVQTGEINVNKRIVEEQQEMDVPVERDDVLVERRPVAESGSGNGDVKKEPYHVGDELHIPVVEERLVVTKKEVVTEEIVITKRKISDTEHISETVRREEVEIDESGLPEGGRPRDV